ncbi:somatolactin-like [Aplochiton taeniatus]
MHEDEVELEWLQLLQGGLWAVLLWPCLFSLGHPSECRDEQGGPATCPSISHDKLLDRVIRHAELIYQVAEESCALYEEMFVPFPMRAQRNQAGHVCVTKAFPSSKSEILQISDRWLLHLVLVLVQSWAEPLAYLRDVLERYDAAPETLLNNTKWVSEKLLGLEQGLVVLIRRMPDEGMLTANHFEEGLVQQDVQSEMLESVGRDYMLLSCFRKDVHKMETLLKLLKCRQNDHYSCTLY